MKKHILVPTDFSATANNAVKYAIQFANAKGFEITFFHSVNSLINDERLAKVYPEEYKRLKTKAENITKENIEKICKKWNLKLNIKKAGLIVSFGPDPVKDILNAAANKKAGMIILGTHGASGLTKVLFGSNTAHVIARSEIPVMAIPGKHNFILFKELVYATDLENVSGELKIMRTLAKDLKAKITTVHFDYGWARDKTELKNIKLAENSGTNYHTHKVSLDVPIIKPLGVYMQRRPEALLCMFHSPKSKISKFLSGSNTEDLSMKLKTPLLSIRKTEK